VGCPRAHELADTFERANEQFTARVANLSDAEWQTFVPQEERTVAALCRHVAWGYVLEVPYFAAIGSGRPLPSLPWSELNAMNAEHGGQFADCSKAEVLEMLDRNGIQAADFLRGLSDEHLQRRGVYVEGGDPWYRATETDIIGGSRLMGHYTGTKAAGDAMALAAHLSRKPIVETLRAFHEERLPVGASIVAYVRRLGEMLTAKASFET